MVDIFLFFFFFYYIEKEDEEIEVHSRQQNCKGALNTLKLVEKDVTMVHIIIYTYILLSHRFNVFLIIT